jgi:hypothetical protein
VSGVKIKYGGMLAWEEGILYLCMLEKQRYPMAQHDNAFSLADIRKKADKIQICFGKSLVYL